MNEQTCEVCGKPATTTIYDLDAIPEGAFWLIEPDDGPWHFCDEHAVERNRPAE
jgi:hypothetical protein